MDMAMLRGLLDPGPEDRQSAMNMGLLQAGLGILANNTNRRNPMPAIGAGGMAGLQGYQQAMDRSQADKMRQLQVHELLRKMQMQQQQEDALAKAPAEVRQAVQMGVPIAEIWKRQNPELKPQLVETADPSDPLRTVKQWMIPGQTQGTHVGYGQLPEILDPRVKGAKKEIAIAGRSNVETKVFNNTKDDFKNERDLRNDFSGLPTTKAFNEVQSAYDQIGVALKKESPAGDLAAATKIMKILDPGSVVRESELGMAMAATGALDRIENYANQLKTGNKLTPSQRKDFGGLAEQLYTAAAARHNQSVEEYRGVASEYGLTPDRIAKPAQKSAMSPGGWSAQRK